VLSIWDDLSAHMHLRSLHYNLETVGQPKPRKRARRKTGVARADETVGVAVVAHARWVRRKRLMIPGACHELGGSS